MSCNSEQFIKADLTAGSYIVFIKPHWKSFVRILSFSVYGPGSTDIVESHTLSAPKIINKIFLNHANVHNHKKIYDLKSLNEPDITYGYFNNKEGFGYSFFYNQSEGSTLEVTVDYSGSRHI